jgi:hypothetical protein
VVRRALKWFLPVVVLVEAALIWSGELGFGDALLVVAAIEGLLLLVGVSQMLLVFRRYRGGRRAGLGPWEALEGGLELVSPRPVARLAVSEPRLFVCLARWAFGRGRLREDEFGYGKGSPLGMLVVMVVLTAPIEVVFWELLVPWSWLRWVLLFLSVYSVLWLLGLYASRVKLPHRLEEDGVRLRQGLFAEVFVPYAEVEDLEKKRRKAPKDGDGLRSSPEGDAAFLAINGRVDLALALVSPLTVRGFLRDTGPVGTIYFAANEPEKMLRVLRRRLEGAPAAGPTATSPVSP